MIQGVLLGLRILAEAFFVKSSDLILLFCGEDFTTKAKYDKICNMKKYCILIVSGLSRGMKALGRAVCFCLVFAYAFSACAYALTIPSNIEVIEAEAFMGDQSITSLTVPDTVKSIGNAAFADISSLSKITVYVR